MHNKLSKSVRCSKQKLRLQTRYASFMRDIFFKLFNFFFCRCSVLLIFLWFCFLVASHVSRRFVVAFIGTKKICRGHLLSAFDEYPKITVVFSVLIWEFGFGSIFLLPFWPYVLVVGLLLLFLLLLSLFFSQQIVFFLLTVRIPWFKSNKKQVVVICEWGKSRSFYTLYTKFNICIAKGATT